MKMSEGETKTKEATMTYDSCPACSGKRSVKYPDHSASVRVCKRCGAVYGSMYLGESYGIVKPYFDPNPEAKSTYFDFTCLGSEGITRRHGWFNPETGLLTQVG